MENTNKSKQKAMPINGDEKFTLTNIDKKTTLTREEKIFYEDLLAEQREQM